MGRDAGATWLFLLLLFAVLQTVDRLRFPQTAGFPVIVFLGVLALTAGPILWDYSRNAGYRIDGSTASACPRCGHFTVDGRSSERLDRLRLRALTRLGFWRIPVYLPLLYLAVMRCLAPHARTMVPGVLVEDALFDAFLISSVTLFCLRRVFIPPPSLPPREPRSTTWTCPHRGDPQDPQNPNFSIRPSESDNPACTSSEARVEKP